eukprot:Skav212362  [mRNA]  locus=scaffold3038:130815:132724:+ [translate_table: standard]
MLRWGGRLVVKREESRISQLRGSNPDAMDAIGSLGLSTNDYPPMAKVALQARLEEATALAEEDLERTEGMIAPDSTGGVDAPWVEPTMGPWWTMG